MNNAINWASVLTEHRSWLETVIRARLSDRHASDDVLQEVAVAVLRQTNRPTERSSIAPWLYRIAIRKIVNYRRHHGRQKTLLHNFASQSPPTETPDVDCRVGLAWLVHAEQSELLSRAIQRLPDSDREILMLKYNHQWTYSEIANRLGVSIKTIEYRLLKAKQTLRRELAGSLGVTR
jgi:RNA polymerase sigma-70 factor (ECF subfamily)